MTKKLLSVFLAILMAISAFIFTGCHDKQNGTSSDVSDSEKNLTAKEKFFNSTAAAVAFLNEAGNTLGFATVDPALKNKKMTSSHIEAELKEVSVMGTQYLSKPIKITSDLLSDINSKNYKMSGAINAGGQDLPFNVLSTSKATYLGIDKVTDKMLKIPMDKSFQILQKLNVYIEMFKDSFGDEYFTEQKGTVTVDGKEITDATTVVFKASAVQLSDALIKVLTQIKTDAKLEDLLSKVQGQETQNDFFVESIEDQIKSLEDSKKDLTDKDYFTCTSITENNVLRSFSFEAQTSDGHNIKLAMTCISKDGTNILKGDIRNGDKIYAEFFFSQKANSSSSADGELNVKIFQRTMFEDSVKIDDIEYVSGDFSTATAVSLIGPEELSVNVKYNGKKDGDKLTVNAKLEVGVKMEDMITTVPVDFIITQEKISSSEIKNSCDISFDAMDTKVKAFVSYSEKYVDVVSIEIPKDGDTVDVMSPDFDSDDSFFTKLSTAYPDFVKFFTDLSDSIYGDWEDISDTPYSVTELSTKDENASFTLFDDGTGYYDATYNNVKYGDGKYSAEFLGKKLTGTYKIDGDKLIVDGKHTYTLYKSEDMVCPDYYINEITGASLDYIKKYNSCEYRVSFNYKIENNMMIITYEDGSIASYSCIVSENAYIIDGVEYIITNNMDVG